MWATATAKPLAAMMTLGQCWAISETWYEGRLDRAYAPPTVAQRQAVLARAGLVGPEWSLG